MRVKPQTIRTAAVTPNYYTMSGTAFFWQSDLFFVLHHAMWPNHRLPAQ